MRYIMINIMIIYNPIQNYLLYFTQEYLVHTLYTKLDMGIVNFIKHYTVFFFFNEKLFFFGYRLIYFKMNLFLFLRVKF